jgi:hypothetical protein
LLLPPPRRSSLPDANSEGEEITINVSDLDPGINHALGVVVRYRKPATRFELHASMQVCQLCDRQGGRGGTKA